MRASCSTERRDLEVEQAYLLARLARDDLFGAEHLLGHRCPCPEVAQPDVALVDIALGEPDPQPRRGDLGDELLGSVAQCADLPGPALEGIIVEHSQFG